MAMHMLSVGLDSFDTCVKLARLCEKYKDDGGIDVLYGRYVVDGASMLGVESLAGHLVSVDAHLSDEAFDRFEAEFEEVMNK